MNKLRNPGRRLNRQIGVLVGEDQIQQMSEIALREDLSVSQSVSQSVRSPRYF